jgi:hypothetical protein
MQQTHQQKQTATAVLCWFSDGSNEAAGLCRCLELHLCTASCAAAVLQSTAKSHSLSHSLTEHTDCNCQAHFPLLLSCCCRCCLMCCGHPGTRASTGLLRTTCTTCCTAATPLSPRATPHAPLTSTSEVLITRHKQLQGA